MSSKPKNGPKLKSERHHWWPECVSEVWKDSCGFVTRLTPDGETRSAPPKNWGVIQNGHIVKIADDPSVFCPWDESYEHQFHNADSNFPKVIEWLEHGYSEDRRHLTDRPKRFTPMDIEDDMFSLVIECIVSLASRSPRTRDRAVALAEHFNGPLPPRKRDGLIGMNIRHFHRDVVRNIGGRGKVAVLYSPEKEFIFGDGFFHTLVSPPTPPHNPMILVPITPNIAVIYARPMQYSTEPRLVSIIANDEEVEAINESVQIHSRDMVFYRSQKPTIIEPFKRNLHLIYANNDNPIDYIIHAIPGIPDRDREMERWLESLSTN